jgi:hypothetical protein
MHARLLPETAPDHLLAPFLFCCTAHILWASGVYLAISRDYERLLMIPKTFFT